MITQVNIPLHQPAEMLLISRVDLQQIKTELQSLQTRYNKLAADQAQWRRFALLGAAMEMVTYRNFSIEGAVDRAEAVLREVERRDPLTKAVNVIDREATTDPGR